MRWFASTTVLEILRSATCNAPVTGVVPRWCPSILEPMLPVRTVQKWNRTVNITTNEH
ncbi:hypothetical protein WAI453_000445 [Rhynchosporium graminicola]